MLRRPIQSKEEQTLSHLSQGCDTNVKCSELLHSRESSKYARPLNLGGCLDSLGCAPAKQGSQNFNGLHGESNWLMLPTFELGDRLKHWTLIELLVGRSKSGHRRWRCRCDCGALRRINERRLTYDLKDSCGCIP